MLYIVSLVIYHVTLLAVIRIRFNFQKKWSNVAITEDVFFYAFSSDKEFQLSVFGIEKTMELIIL